MCSTNVTFSTAWPGHVLPDGLRCSQVVFGFFNGTPSPWNICVLLHLTNMMFSNLNKLVWRISYLVVDPKWGRMGNFTNFMLVTWSARWEFCCDIICIHLKTCLTLETRVDLAILSSFCPWMTKICDSHLHAQVLYAPISVLTFVQILHSSHSGTTCFSCLHLESLHENVLRWGRSTYQLIINLSI